MVSVIKLKWVMAVFVLVFALSLRLSTLNQMGKTWDEGAYVEPGYKYVQLFSKHHFNDSFWYLQSDHPPLVRYFYGIASIFDLEKIDKNNTAVFKNSYTGARTVSAIAGAISAMLVFLIGYKFFSSYVAFSSGVIFSLIPFFVGLSQLATLESFIMLSFTSCVYFYLNYLTSFSRKQLVFSGIALGCAMLVKQSNVLLLPLLFVIFTIYYLFQKKQKLLFFFKKLYHFIGVFLVAIFTFFVLWPMPFFHLNEVLDVQNKMWVHAVKLPPPEVFFGRLMLVPLPYYFVMFVITTPLVLLFLGALGALKIDKTRTAVSISILVWFLFPFLQSFYAFKQHGVRYIIEIYAPFALLCGIGLEYFAEKYSSIKFIKGVSLLFVCIYLFIILFKVSPYYLDYFNEVVGGNNYVYQHRLFQMGWWGQGIEEAAKYISKHEKKSVTVAVDGGQPATVMPKLWNIKTVYYDKNKTFDYVLVPYFNIVRLGFPENELKGKYHVIYEVLVDKAKLVKVYKKN